MGCAPGVQHLQDWCVPVFELADLPTIWTFWCIQTVSFVPAEARCCPFIAQVLGRDPNGNSVGPVDASATLNATRGRKAFDITLYDASPLSKIDHPFSRWLLHHDPNTGCELPMVGAVIGGAALLRSAVAGLTATESVSVTLRELGVPEHQRLFAGMCHLLR